MSDNTNEDNDTPRRCCHLSERIYGGGETPVLFPRQPLKSLNLTI